MDKVINSVTRFGFEKITTSYIVIHTLNHKPLGPYLRLYLKCDIDMLNDSKTCWVLPESFVYGDRLT